MRKKNLYYHGTSADKLPIILKQGLRPVWGKDHVWNASYPHNVYLWDSSHKECCNPFDDAALMGAIACLRAKDKRIVVFEFEVPAYLMYPDNSDEVSASFGAVCTARLSLRYLKQYSVSEDISVLTPFIAAYVKELPGYNHVLTSLEVQAADAVDNCNFFFSEVFHNWSHFTYTRNNRVLKPCNTA